MVVHRAARPRGGGGLGATPRRDPQPLRRGVVAPLRPGRGGGGGRAAGGVPAVRGPGAVTGRGGARRWPRTCRRSASTCPATPTTAAASMQGDLVHGRAGLAARPPPHVVDRRASCGRFPAAARTSDPPVVARAVAGSAPCSWPTAARGPCGPAPGTRCGRGSRERPGPCSRHGSPATGAARHRPRGRRRARHAPQRHLRRHPARQRAGPGHVRARTTWCAARGTRAGTSRVAHSCT